MNETDLTARFEWLELRVMRQDQTIDALNETVTEQWRQIDRLVREVMRLGEIADGSNGVQTKPETPPPHY